MSMELSDIQHKSNYYSLLSPPLCLSLCLSVCLSVRQSLSLCVLLSVCLVVVLPPSLSPSLPPSFRIFLSPSLPPSSLSRWISVLTNSKEEALNVAFQGGGAQSTAGDSSMEELTRSVIEEVLRMPGNDSCCDCGAPGRIALGLPLVAHV